MHEYLEVPMLIWNLHSHNNLTCPLHSSYTDWIEPSENQHTRQPAQGTARAIQAEATSSKMATGKAMSSVKVHEQPLLPTFLRGCVLVQVNHAIRCRAGEQLATLHGVTGAPVLVKMPDEHQGRKARVVFTTTLPQGGECSIVSHTPKHNNGLSVSDLLAIVVSLWEAVRKNQQLVTDGAALALQEVIRMLREWCKETKFDASIFDGIGPVVRAAAEGVAVAATGDGPSSSGGHGGCGRGRGRIQHSGSCPNSKGVAASAAGSSEDEEEDSAATGGDGEDGSGASAWGSSSCSDASDTGLDGEPQQQQQPFRPRSTRQAAKAASKLFSQLADNV